MPAPEAPPAGCVVVVRGVVAEAVVGALREPLDPQPAASAGAARDTRNTTRAKTATVVFM